MLAEVLTDWCDENNIELAYIQPDKPNQNAYIERSNCSHRNEVLNPYLFITLRQARELSAAWLISYNEEQTDDSAGRIPGISAIRCAEIWGTLHPYPLEQFSPATWFSM